MPLEAGARRAEPCKAAKGLGVWGWRVHEAAAPLGRVIWWWPGFATAAYVGLLLHGLRGRRRTRLLLGRAALGERRRWRPRAGGGPARGEWAAAVSRGRGGGCPGHVRGGDGARGRGGKGERGQWDEGARGQDRSRRFDHRQGQASQDVGSERRVELAFR